MKKIISIRLVIFILIIQLFAGCKKTEIDRFSFSQIVDAGRDTVIVLPVNSIFLDGSASSRYADNKIVSYLWTLVSGPQTLIITEPNSAKTMLKNLDKGTYLFELTVTYNGGDTFKDNVQVTVWDPQYIYTKFAADTTITLPYDRAYLKGRANIYNSSHTWKKIDGPNTPGPSSSEYASEQIVYDLIEGVYKFKLTTTYFNQLIHVDTMTIRVLPDTNIYTTEKVFENLSWDCRSVLWACTVTINNISSFIPLGIAYKVYIKTDSNSDWEIVIDETKDPSHIYTNRYMEKNNGLIINTPDIFSPIIQGKIKIVY